MPFWSNSSREANYKTKLQHKLRVAKETPEPVFDLADCNLYEVPPGVFSMCRVFLKEVLLLQNNQLHSLQNGGSLKDLNQLKILNLNSNKFSSLPESIGNLSCLQVLNLEENRLKGLPDSFKNLRKLRTLILKGNKLREFPMVLCNLSCLQVLNICDNDKLNVLPKELCGLVHLENLQLDVDNITYPPQEICSEGTESIMKFLCNESGKDYIPASQLVLDNDDLVDFDDATEELSWNDAGLSASYQQYQRAKEQRHLELVQMEEDMKNADELQAHFAEGASVRRKKLLEDVTQEQERLDEEIILIQNKKEKEKQTLLAVLSNIEDHSAKLIEQLMCLNEKNKNIEGILESLEQDRMETEEMFTIKQEELEGLRKHDILNAMKDMLQAEERQREYAAGKLEISKRLQESANENDLKLLDVLCGREQDQQILINKLLVEELFQKEAFEALQILKDKRHQEITYQIRLIEKELSKLTLAEIKKQDLKANFEINILADHRTALAQLLANLLQEKEQRVLELKERLQQMEQKRLDEMKDFWLIQYQKLMDKKPQELVNAELTMDPIVRAVLIDAGATNFLTLFAVKFVTWAQLLTMSVKDLKKIGILDESLCEAIIFKTEEHFADVPNVPYKPQEILSASFQVPSPSAPPPEEVEEEEPGPSGILPSAPLLSPNSEIKLWCETECVVCLDKQSTAVFIPCGHVCCCWNCAKSLTTCPMCRNSVTSKFLLTFS